MNIEVEVLFLFIFYDIILGDYFFEKEKISLKDKSHSNYI